jgi:molybdopterin-guanine dinucleotide biosynthesis protein A
VLEQATPPAPVLVLATDLPQLGSGDVDRLVAALGGAQPGVEGVLFVDDQDTVQPLAAIYRRAALVRAIAGLQPVADRPMRAVLSRLTMIGVPDHGAAADVDTAEQLAAARAAQDARAAG